MTEIAVLLLSRGDVVALDLTPYRDTIAAGLTRRIRR